MTSEEQKDFNEQLERLSEANGEPYSAVKNSEGDIENIYRGIEQRKPLEESAKKEVSESYKPSFTEKLRKGKLDRDRLFQEFDDASWYQRAANHVRAFCTGKDYLNIIMEKVDKQIDTELDHLEKTWDETKDKCAEMYKDLTQSQIETENLSSNYGSLEGVRSYNPDDPGPGIDMLKTARKIESLHAKMSGCKRMISCYESFLQRVNSRISTLNEFKQVLQDENDLEVIINSAEILIEHPQIMMHPKLLYP